MLFHKKCVNPVEKLLQKYLNPLKMLALYFFVCIIEHIGRY